MKFCLSGLSPDHSNISKTSESLVLCNSLSHTFHTCIQLHPSSHELWRYFLSLLTKKITMSSCYQWGCLFICSVSFPLVCEVDKSYSVNGFSPPSLMIFAARLILNLLAAYLINGLLAEASLWSLTRTCWQNKFVFRTPIVSGCSEEIYFYIYWGNWAFYVAVVFFLASGWQHFEWF